ncbi:MFS transporter [Campylobacter sp. MIT 12-5580]|uniref:MFS transporter n=1 Tax=Campylobacter sp. MIT 12-5580 TaxID=2040651 RepID=UPI0010F8197F|nr:MFS transporter [Campylobacter sp. MIT 12-5580]TKX28651.1 MFS transporter [Campylobacter sp. MIT 12-5580]
MRKKAVKNTLYASLGGILEFYDYILFVFFAKLFAEIFFPPNNAFWAEIGIWISFGAGYLARPFGAVVFAHFGDKKGRKDVFYITMLLMILPSFALAFLPSYESIGLTATIILFVIRILQGLAVGAEVSGAWVFVSEFVSQKYKSLALGFISATLTLGLLLAGLVSLLANEIFTQEELKAWAWRLPFILGGFFGVLACFLRKKLSETPVFEKLRKDETLLSFPLLEALKTHKLAMLVCALMSVVLTSGVATLTIVPQHFNALLGFDTNQSLIYSNLAIVAIIFGSLIQGALASFFGNFKICVLFSLLFAVFGIGLGLYDERFLFYYLLACFMQGIISFAPIFMTSVFKPELRFSGLSFAYNISYALLAFVTPFVIRGIYEKYLGYYFVFVALCSLLCAFLVRHLNNTYLRRV